MTMSDRPLSLIVNGVARDLRVAAHATLLEVLRGDLGLTGPQEGCAEGACGACLVLVDGRPMLSCLMLAALAEGQHIETVEGLAAADGTLSAVQRAFVEQGATGCGFCTAGMVMAATHALRINPWITEDEARAALMGNLCRCTGYEAPVAAVMAAARVLQEGGR